MSEQGDGRKETKNIGGKDDDEECVSWPEIQGIREEGKGPRNRCASEMPETPEMAERRENNEILSSTAVLPL